MGTVFNLPTFKSSTFVFKLFKLVGTLKNVAMSSQLHVTVKSNTSKTVACSNTF